MSLIINEEELVKSIEKIIAKEDLDLLSRKMVRKLLQKQFNDPLVDYKTFINDKVVELVTALQNPDVKEEKTKSGFNAELVLSPELADFLNEERLSRPKVVKAMWQYIKDNQLQNENDKRSILLNEKLKNVFNVDSFTMFEMNKYLSRHLKSAQDLKLAGGWDNIKRDGNLKPSVKKPRAKKDASKKKRNPKRKSDSATGFTAPIELSKDLAELMGQTNMARTQVVKNLWVYIKENELQNPENKKEIICDEKLKHLFQQDIVTMFSMNKFLKPHFIQSKKAKGGDTTSDKSDVAMKSFDSSDVKTEMGDSSIVESVLVHATSQSNDSQSTSISS